MTTAQFYYINDFLALFNDSREKVVLPFLIRSLTFYARKDISESVGILPVYALKTGFLPWQMNNTFIIVFSFLDLPRNAVF